MVTAFVWLFVGCLFPLWLPALPLSTVKVASGIISLGATVRAKNNTAAAILKRADENLYSVKKAGRNRVVLR